jgi:hypothetical protein
MRGALPPLPQYTFMAWCSVQSQGQLYLLHFTFLYYTVKVYIKFKAERCIAPEGEVYKQHMCCERQFDIWAAWPPPPPFRDSEVSQAHVFMVPLFLPRKCRYIVFRWVVDIPIAAQRNSIPFGQTRRMATQASVQTKLCTDNRAFGTDTGWTLRYPVLGPPRLLYKRYRGFFTRNLKLTQRAANYSIPLRLGNKNAWDLTLTALIRFYGVVLRHRENINFYLCSI